jgi:hypothetical protein
VKTSKPPEKTLRFLRYAGQRTASAAWGGEPASGVVSRYRGVALELDRARVRGRHDVVPETLQSLNRGADVLPADELLRCGHPPRAVLCEQRREAVLVAHHRGVGELAAQRLDLEAVSDGLKVAHRFPPSSAPSGCRCGSSRTRPDPFGIGRNRSGRADARVPSGPWPPLAADGEQERGRTVLMLDQRVHPVPPARWLAGYRLGRPARAALLTRTPLVAAAFDRSSTLRRRHLRLAHDRYGRPPTAALLARTTVLAAASCPDQQPPPHLIGPAAARSSGSLPSLRRGHVRGAARSCWSASIPSDDA